MNSDFLFEKDPSYYNGETYENSNGVILENKYDVDIVFKTGNNKDWKVLSKPVRINEDYREPLINIVDKETQVEENILILIDNLSNTVNWIYHYEDENKWLAHSRYSILPIAQKIASQTIGLNLVSVKPITTPSANLMYLDYVYKPKSSIQYLDIPITITSSNSTNLKSSKFKKKAKIIKDFFKKLIKKAKSIF